MRELPDGIDVSALDDACYEYHREYVTDWNADHLAPRVAAIREALGLGDAQPGVLRHAVREWMDADQDYSELRATIVSDLRILADRDEVTTGDIHALADEIESGGEFAPISTPAAVTPEPAGPRELSVWRIVAGKRGHRGNRFRENNGALEVLGGDGVNDWLPSRWRSLDELRADGYTLTEVPAVPPAEPGAGA